jgi:hypothetical protein
MKDRFCENNLLSSRTKPRSDETKALSSRTKASFDENEGDNREMNGLFARMNRPSRRRRARSREKKDPSAGD